MLTPTAPKGHAHAHPLSAGPVRLPDLRQCAAPPRTARRRGIPRTRVSPRPPRPLLTCCVRARASSRRRSDYDCAPHPSNRDPPRTRPLLLTPRLYCQSTTTARRTCGRSATSRPPWRTRCASPASPTDPIATLSAGPCLQIMLYGCAQKEVMGLDKAVEE